MRRLRRHASRPATLRTPAAGNRQATAPAARDSAVPLDVLLREVAQFRVALDADLLIAAAAADEGEPELAAGIVDDERTRLAAFHESFLERLAGLRDRDRAEQQLRRRRSRHAAAAVAAAVTVGVLAGGVALAVRPEGRVLPAAAAQAVTTAPVAQSVGNRARPVALETRAEGEFARLASAVRLGAGSAEIARRVQTLHLTLARLTEQAAGQAEVAHTARRLLSAERRLLAEHAPDVASRTAPRAQEIAEALATLP